MTAAKGRLRTSFFYAVFPACRAGGAGRLGAGLSGTYMEHADSPAWLQGRRERPVRAGMDSAGPAVPAGKHGPEKRDF